MNWAAIRDRRALRQLLSPHGLLVAACAAHLLLCVVLVATGHLWWYQDEVVYVSQVGAHTPAVVFTPPRARGLPVLLFPFVHFTTHVAYVRAYISLLGTLFLYVGLRPWLRLGYGRLVALAATLFGALWAATFFGAAAQPNFFVAAVAAGALGWALLALREIDVRRNLIAVAGALGLFALLRPSDATWFAVAIGLSLIAVRSVVGRRRISVVVAMVVGLIAGWSEWVIEAYASYGGFFHRIHEANAYNTPGLHFSLGAEARSINGPLLCRPCGGMPVTTSHILWWFALPPLAALGLFAARRTARFVPLVLSTVAAVTLLLEYLLTTNYGAPRFLLPTYLLIALPCAAGIVALVRWRPTPRARLATLAVVCVVLLVQLVDQTVVLHQTVVKAANNRDRFLAAAKVLRSDGVKPPCIVYGDAGPPVAYALGCNDHPFGSAAFGRVASGTSVAVLTATPDNGQYGVDMQDVKLRPGSGWTAHLLRPREATKATDLENLCLHGDGIGLVVVCATSHDPS